MTDSPTEEQWTPTEDEIRSWIRVKSRSSNRGINRAEAVPTLQRDHYASQAEALQAEVERLREAMDLAAHQIEGDAPMMGHVRANPAYTLRAALSPQPEEDDDAST